MMSLNEACFWLLVASALLAAVCFMVEAFQRTRENQRVMRAELERISMHAAAVEEESKDSAKEKRWCASCQWFRASNAYVGMSARGPQDQALAIRPFINFRRSEP